MTTFQLVCQWLNLRLTLLSDRFITLLLLVIGPKCQNNVTKVANSKYSAKMYVMKKINRLNQRSKIQISSNLSCSA